MSDTGRRKWWVSVLIAVVLVGAACRSADDAGGENPTTTATSEVVLESSTTELPAPEPPETTTTETRDERGRAAASVFAFGIRSPFQMVELDSPSLAAVARQFAADERIAAEVNGVDARVLRQQGEDIGAVVALAIEPASALDENWRADFEAGLVAGAIRPPVPSRIGTEPAVRFPVRGPGDDVYTSLLWRWDNVFVLFTGPDAALLDQAAEGLLDLVVGPFPTTTTQPPTTTTDPAESATTTATTVVDG